MSSSENMLETDFGMFVANPGTSKDQSRFVLRISPNAPFPVDTPSFERYNLAVMDLLAGLNPQQQQAVMAGLGPVLVLAGPGSGKTRVLIHRIAYLIGSMGIRPYHILAVTFTNKAAREMEARVESILGNEAHGLTLGTFHATCARILRREAEHLPFDSNFVIFDSDDQLSLVRRAITDLNIDEKKFRAAGVHASISRAKNELILPAAFPIQNYRDEVVKRVYQRYQELLLANNALDFDDLLFWMAIMLEDKPEVREKYARRYEHVLVDEFQDTNMAQYLLLKHLASFHRNLFVVGDTDQSIYRWRGADYRNVQRFEKDFPDTQVILLEQNYRSTQLILNAAMAVIDRNPYRTRKQLFTQRGEGQKIVLYEAGSDRVEASFVIETIAAMVARKEAKPGDFAVMYRTNAQSRILEEAFLAAGLAYKLVGAQRFYGRREIKDVIAYLRLVRNPNDEVSLTRVINVPPRSIGDKSLLNLRNQALKAGTSPGLMILDLARGEAAGARETLSGRALNSLVSFGAHLSSWRGLATELPPLALMDRILEETDYHAYIDDGTDEGHERWENVMELRRLAAEYSDQGLDAFLERVALVSDQDTVESSANVPTLLTLHAAKGLEFPIVMIIGLDDGTFPHQRSFEDPEAMMEERRLFYVGITRAENLLYLLYPLSRSSYGYAEPTISSRFLDDIPFELLSEENFRRSGSRQSKGSKAVARRADRWETSPAVAARKIQSRYPPGSRVMHPVWGEGMVLNSRIEDDDEIVDIFFENMGLKRVAASLAKLEIKT
jgi:DNA helicase II / ATP-dependent DNA helicase PcrA